MVAFVPSFASVERLTLLEMRSRAVELLSGIVSWYSAYARPLAQLSLFLEGRAGLDQTWAGSVGRELAISNTVRLDSETIHLLR